MRFILLVVMASSLLGACARGDSRSVILRDSAGIAIAENAADAIDRAAVWTIDSQPALTIGQTEGEPAYQLYRVAGAARLSDGRIAVLNSATSEVRFFGADGSHLRTAGRKGDGPGELREPGPLVHLPGDSLGVWDESRQGITVFSPRGDYVRSARFDQPATNAELVGAFADGSLVMADFRFNIPKVGFEPSPAVLTRYSRDGTLTDSLGSYEWREIGMIDPVDGIIGSRTFAPRTSTAIHGDRFWIGTGHEPSIEVRSEQGRLLRVIRWVEGDRTVPPGEAARYFEARNPDAPPDRRRRFESLPVMDRFPTHSTMIADAGGNLWVQRYRRPSASGPAEWLIFDGEGTLIARAALPQGLRVFEIGGDFVLGVQPDAEEVEQVVLYSLARARDER